MEIENAIIVKGQDISRLCSARIIISTQVLVAGDDLSNSSGGCDCYQSSKFHMTKVIHESI